MRELDVDLLSVAGHKLYAPKGVGALYVRRGTPLVPFALGAGHERGLRPGTENVASIVGLGAACEAVGRDLEAAASRMRALRDALWERLAAAVPGLALNGHRELRLPNTLNVRFPRATGDAVLAGAPEVAASTGLGVPRGPRERVGGDPRDGRRARGRARLGAPHARARHDGGRCFARRARRWCGPGGAWLANSHFPFKAAICAPAPRAQPTSFLSIAIPRSASAGVASASSRYTRPRAS